MIRLLCQMSNASGCCKLLAACGLVEIRFCSLTRVSTGSVWTRCGMLPVCCMACTISFVAVLFNTLKLQGGRGSDLNLSVAVLLAATGGKHVPLRFSVCCTVVCALFGATDKMECCLVVAASAF